MAVNKNVYMGGLSGKMGNLVAYERNGMTHIRKSPEFKKNRKRSEAQLLAEAKFQFATRFMRNINELVSLTFESTGNLSSRNAALRNIVTQAVEGTIDNLSINYSQVLMSGGFLKKCIGSAVSTDPGKINFTWRNNDPVEARNSDRSVLVAYCEETDEIWYTNSGPQRVTEAAQLDVPFFSGKQVHTWLGFVSSKGKRAADSIYTGLITVA